MITILNVAQATMCTRLYFVVIGRWTEGPATPMADDNIVVVYYYKTNDYEQKINHAINLPYTR